MKRIWELLTIYDKVLIIVLMGLSLFFIISPAASLLTGIGRSSASDSGARVVVIQSGDGSQQRLLLKDTYQQDPIIVKVQGPIGTSVVEVYQGRVRLKEAPPTDPQKICEKTGWIDQVGPMIICVPNKISIWIEEKESDLDGVSW